MGYKYQSVHGVILSNIWYRVSVVNGSYMRKDSAELRSEGYRNILKYDICFLRKIVGVN